MSERRAASQQRGAQVQQSVLTVVYSRVCCCDAMAQVASRCAACISSKLILPPLFPSPLWLPSLSGRSASGGHQLQGAAAAAAGGAGGAQRARSGGGVERG